MKALPRIGLLAALVALTASGALVPLHAQEVGLPLGTQAPSAVLEDLDGNAVELLDYTRGKPALLEFWATWCENCEALQPQMDQIHARYGDRIQVVAVAVAVSQTVRRVKRHLDAHAPGYRYLWDANGAA
ncbi:MAG TPA: redoxin domain-containing protein, partial [Longimicrobiales bacterium]|nr:redoxin domain-containing protein [Longimicrobiales bacterium]